MIRGPRNYGLMIILLGTVCLAAAALQHRSASRRIYALIGEPFRYSLSFIVALVVIGIGVISFVSITIGIDPF
jgi:hypothetical protein